MDGLEKGEIFYFFLESNPDCSVLQPINRSLYRLSYHNFDLRNWLTNILWKRVVPEKPTGALLLRDSPHFMEPEGSTAFRSICNLCLKKPCEMFRNIVSFYGEELLAPHPSPKLEDHLLSVVRDCLFNIFAATFHIWRSFLHPQPDERHVVVTVTHLSRQGPTYH